MAILKVSKRTSEIRSGNVRAASRPGASLPTQKLANTRSRTSSGVTSDQVVERPHRARRFWPRPRIHSAFPGGLKRVDSPRADLATRYRGVPRHDRLHVAQHQQARTDFASRRFSPRRPVTAEPHGRPDGRTVGGASKWTRMREHEGALTCARNSSRAVPLPSPFPFPIVSTTAPIRRRQIPSITSFQPLDAIVLSRSPAVSPAGTESLDTAWPHPSPGTWDLCHDRSLRPQRVEQQ